VPGFGQVLTELATAVGRVPEHLTWLVLDGEEFGGGLGVGDVAGGEGG
jgi:hypothetical protein